VKIEVAHPEDHYGDIFVDRCKAQDIYEQWLAMTRPQLDRADGFRRPPWMIRPYRPAASAFRRQR
jgi:hypothetical protein